MYELKGRFFIFKVFEMNNPAVGLTRAFGKVEFPEEINPLTRRTIRMSHLH